MELKPTKPQLLIMLHHNNVNIRALAVIYVRLCVNYELIYAILKEVWGD